MIIYHDCEYREKDALMECEAPITGKVTTGDPAIKVRTLPGGTSLSLIHKGPYTGLLGAWSRIGMYAEERNLQSPGHTGKCT